LPARQSSIFRPVPVSLWALLYRKKHPALPLLEGAIGTPIQSGRIYGLLAEIYQSNGRPDDAHHVRQKGQAEGTTPSALIRSPFEVVTQ
jgi:hypothetical protein